MKKWKFNGEIEAGKIVEVELFKDPTNVVDSIHLKLEGHDKRMAFRLDDNLFAGFPTGWNVGALLGRYYVLYGGSLEDILPAEAFERGFSDPASPAPQTDDDKAIAALLEEEPIGKFFSYSHLPGSLSAKSKPFAVLASAVIANTPRNAERSVALRKLLEAKDAAVRANL
jgi:hypothetical protein